MGDDSNSFLSDVINSFRETPNSEFEELSSVELSSRYPCLKMGDNVKACYDPQAGVIMADKALKVIWVRRKWYCLIYPPGEQVGVFS